MATDNPTDHASVEAWSPAAEDAQTEGAVLAFLLVEHPAQLTISELSLALNRDPGDFSSSDAIERAVRELVGAGLLYCQGAFVLPTRAALRFDRLDFA
jgi:hypothetical protein